ncbi:MAG: tetratricopeptide repeat protein, partial [bacterium]|nr:tetratricopeptide repeat protein [bacterium]
VDTDNLPAQLGLATMHEQMNEVESAYDIYSRLRSLYPEHAWVKVRYENIKSTETQKYLEQAQQFKTDNKRPEYIEALEKAAAYSPEIIEIEIEIADFFYAGEDYKKAATHYERILEKLPNKEDILVKLAEVYEKSGQYDLAVVMYKRLLELKPGDIVFLNKVNDLKFKFYELNLPEKFKNIFFKQDISREELAALIGYYFAKHLETRPPMIITDITGSFARDYIIKVCTLGIMKIRPDHSFDRFPIINRTAYVAVIDALLRYLRVDRSSEIRLPPLETVIEPADVSPLHKNYKIIKYLINSQLVKLDPDNKFNPTIDVKPAEVLVALKKILTGLEKK